MIGILACGLPPASASGEHPNLRAFGASAEAGGPPAARAAALLDVVAPALRDGATVVAVVPTWDLEPTLAQLHVARSALESTRLVIHRTSLPPLAAGALVRALAQLAGQGLVSDAVLLSTLGAAERGVVGAAWLGSVAKLRHPAPPVALHARSYLPGTAFGAVVDDDPRVVKLARKGAATLDLPQPRTPGGWRVVVAEGEDADTDLVRRSISRHAPGAPTEHVELTDVSTGWWGTDKLVEVALVPADLVAFARSLAADADVRPCPWCGEDIAADPCPYCGVRATAPPLSLDDVPTGGPA